MQRGLCGEYLFVLRLIVNTWLCGQKSQSSCCKTSESAGMKYDKLELKLYVSKQQIPQKQTSICWKPARQLLGYDKKKGKKRHEPTSSCA